MKATTVVAPPPPVVVAVVGVGGSGITMRPVVLSILFAVLLLIAAGDIVYVLSMNYEVLILPCPRRVRAPAVLCVCVRNTEGGVCAR